MSFFKNLFSGNAPAPVPSEPAPAPADPADALPEFFKGMTLDVVTSEGTQLLTGRVSEHTSNSLTLERLPGWLSFDTCDEGQKVFVRGFNKRMQSFNLQGTVSESSRIICRLDDLKVEHVNNQRLSFRLPVHSTASLFRDDDERFSKPEPCTLVDLSTGGACVETEYIHAEDEILFLRFKLEDYPTMTFRGQIIRGTEYKSGVYRYGILFAQLDQDELTNLTRTLYNVQTGNRNTWNRGKDGTWNS